MSCQVRVQAGRCRTTIMTMRSNTQGLYQHHNKQHSLPVYPVPVHLVSSTKNNNTMNQEKLQLVINWWNWPLLNKYCLLIVIGIWEVTHVNRSRFGGSYAADSSTMMSLDRKLTYKSASAQHHTRWSSLRTNAGYKKTPIVCLIRCHWYHIWMDVLDQSTVFRGQQNMVYVS